MNIEVPTGDGDIDRVRMEVRTQPTDETNYEERLYIYRSWRHLLQRRGILVDPVIPADDRRQLATEHGDFSEACAAIDDIFAILEKLQRSEPR